uniref:Uncharacterized protein n=1 Tax=Panagrolaimus sp. PS1159 TaxID=55785 RepID=A0AC35EWF5_9BILA
MNNYRHELRMQRISTNKQKEDDTNESKSIASTESNEAIQMASSSIKLTETQSTEFIVDEAETAPKKVKKWVVQQYEMLPIWLRDNEFIINGHRPPLPSVKDCIKSICSIHSETGNIWTHLL